MVLMTCVRSETVLRRKKMSLQPQTKTQQNQIRDTAQVIKDANDVFEGIGKLKGYQYQIEIDDKVQPVVSHGYSVPPPMQEPLKKNLDWMVDIDVIKKQKVATKIIAISTGTDAPSQLSQVGGVEASPGIGLIWTWSVEECVPVVSWHDMAVNRIIQ